MRRLRLIFWVLLFFGWGIPAVAQVDTAWVRRYDGPGNSKDSALALAVDGSGNVYVTGRSDDSVTFSDYATIKYAPNGDTLWVRRYDGPGNGSDYARALEVDNSGNVYVTGNSGTVKYSPSGAEDPSWIVNTGVSGSALAVDDSGNVYVTGSSYDTGTYYDYATIKYTPNGDTLWVRHYNGPGNYWDGASDLAVDDSGNVYLTGGSHGSGFWYDYATIKYASNGDTLWVRRYDGPGNSYDYGAALALDGSGNVYVTGSSLDADTSSDYATIKYDPNGDPLWVRRYDGPGNGWDGASDLAVDDSGNVYVTGASIGTAYPDYDYATIKYAERSPDTSLVGYWKFDEGTGTIAYDSSGYENDGTLSGAAWVNGKCGQALSFADVGDYVEISNSPSLDITGSEFTLSAWVYPRTQYRSFEDIIAKRSGTIVQYYLNLGWNASEVNFATGLYNGSNVYFYSNEFHPLNNWYYVVGVYDGTRLRLYVNNQLEIDEPVTGNLVSLNVPVYIAWMGPTWWPGDWHFMGNVDEVKIYNRALSADEIRQEYENERCGCIAKPGDANADSSFTLADVIAIVNYIFKKAGWPTCSDNNYICWLHALTCRGEWDASGLVDLADAIRAVNYIFKKTGWPVCSANNYTCWLPPAIAVCCVPGP